MKKIRTILFLSLLGLLTSCGIIPYSSTPYSARQDINVAIQKNGFWGESSKNSIAIYDQSDHPSQFKILITCNSYTYEKEDGWYTYKDCYITYDTDILQALCTYRVGGRRLTKPCTVKVHKGRFEEIYHKGKTFNVFVGNVAFGIEVHHGF